MAESQDGQERTEDPTAKRLREAREKGQMARSKELATLVVLICAALGLLLLGDGIIDGLLNVMYSGFSVTREDALSPRFGMNLFVSSVGETLLSLAPFLALMVVAALGGSIALGGWNFSTKAFSPKFSKMNPISGAKRIVGFQGLMELAKSLIKFFVIGGIGVALLWSFYEEVLSLGREPLRQAAAHGATMLMWAFLLVSMAMILVAAVDAPFQLWQHKRQMKMTKQEVKQERKETDGSPEVKQRIRQAQQEIAIRRMMQAVPQADVVVTNPTHFAVAIKYDQKNMRAPIVVAKGADLVAFEIRRVAKESNVPILSAPPLARAIYHSTELGQEVPEKLYVAVAQVLAYIFHLRQKGRRHYDETLTMSDIPVPDDMKFDDSPD